MNNLTIPQTKQTPEVHTDITNGVFSIKGRSLSEDSVNFYANIFSFFEEYYKTPCPLTTFEMTFEYLNSTSLKLVTDLLMYAKKSTDSSKKIKFKWFYEEDDDDILMTGKEIERIIGSPFEFHPYTVK